MFRPRTLADCLPQKLRSLRYHINLLQAHGIPVWPGLITIGTGQIASSVADRMAIISRKVVSSGTGSHKL